MRRAKVKMHAVHAGWLVEKENSSYTFSYLENYHGPPISLTMPLSVRIFDFDKFPAFFDGLLPEGQQLGGLLKIGKIDKDDYFGQLVATGENLIGAVTVHKEPNE